MLFRSGMQPAALVSTGMTFVKMIRAFKGPRYRSKFLTNLSLGSNNKPFKPNRTTCDWLTRDEAIVDAYVADERNQFMFTVSAFADMFEGIKTLYQKANLDKMNRDIPVLIASGADDPVGDMGKAAPAYGKQLEELGFKDVTVKLYEEGRHELVNELNYEEIYRDIASFILKYVA